MSFNFKKMSPMSIEDENFWPSFADIMMLVVMIFLMVMVVLVIKNWDLVEKLKVSIQTEQKIAQEVESAQSKNKELKGALDTQSQQVAQLQLELMQLRENLQAVEISLEESQEREQGMEQTIILLTDEKRDLEGQVKTLGVNLDQSKVENEQQKTVIIKLEENAAKAKEEFSALKYKYDKLIRPARTPKGKTVVEISLTQEQGKRVIRLREPGGVAKVLNQLEMESILKKYKEQDPDKLYLKIIFPEGSSISHSEAWKFTSRLLEKYDYYYQK